MRIRKHAKFSPLAYATSSLNPGIVLQTHVCQLNQSPWDVMSFSPPSTPPPLQVTTEYGVSVENGSSGNCISVVERELDTWRRSNISNAMHKIEEPPPPSPKNEQIILCCKTDGKSWRCRREAAKGDSLCEHHSTLIKSYSNSAHNTSKKMIKPAEEAPRHTRPKKTSASSSSKSHEFYYYSGFGPRWGKKRGEIWQESGSTISKKIGDEMENELESRGEDFDYAEYEEYDEDDEDEENRDNGRKRVRKPIKARSLKSLM